MKPTRHQPDNVPNKKVIAGALTTIGAALIISMFHRVFGYTPDPDIAAAITIVVYSLTSYFVPEWADKVKITEENSGDSPRTD